MSIPRPKTSVATMIRAEKSLKLWYLLILRRGGRKKKQTKINITPSQYKNKLREEKKKRKPETGGVNSPLLLIHPRMNTNTWKLTLDKQLAQFRRALHRLDKDTDLVKLELVQQVVQLSVFFILIQLDIVLLEAVKCELGLVVYIDFEWL